MWAYLSRTKYEYSHAMAQVVKEAWNKILNNHEWMRLLSYMLQRESAMSKKQFNYERDLAKNNISSINICKHNFKAESFQIMT